jgi:hypothetical protein
LKRRQGNAQKRQKKVASDGEDQEDSSCCHNGTGGKTPAIGVVDAFGQARKDRRRVHRADSHEQCHKSGPKF